MPRTEKYVVKKLLHFEKWMADAVMDVRFEERLNAESDAFRLLIKEALEARGVEVPKDAT